MAAGQRYGVAGTPTYFIGKTRVAGLPPAEILTRLIDQEMDNAG